MKLAYLLNTYPLISTTFIRREIEAIEELGQPVHRFALRHWEGTLVDPKDMSDQKQTHYILTGGKGALVKDVLLETISNPVRLLGALPLWWRLYRNAGRNFVHHGAYLMEAMAFRRRTAAIGIDHVHVHFSTNAATVALLARKLGGPSYSFTVHGPDELINPPSLSLAEKSRGAAFVVAITDYCRGQITREAPDTATKVSVVHCGIDLNDYRYDPTVPEAATVVCVGRLCHNKGQKHIPAALAQLKGEFPDIKIILIGGGEDEDLIRQEAVRHGVEKNIILQGWGTGEQVRAGILSTRALLLPSYAEGLPIVIMEALATGRPVLTTRITGIPELVDAECGWIFEPGDVAAIADALRGIMKATVAERAAMGAEGRRRVEERHDVVKSARTLLDAFKETAGR